MSDFRGKFSRKDPTARWLLMIIDQVAVITCSDAADFTSEKTFANILCLM